MFTDLSFFSFPSNCKTLVHWQLTGLHRVDSAPRSSQAPTESYSSIISSRPLFNNHVAVMQWAGNWKLWFFTSTIIETFYPLSTVHWPLVSFSFRVLGLSKNPEGPKRLFGKCRTLIQNWEDPKLEAKRPKPERPTLNSPAEMSKMVKFLRNLNVIIWLMGNWIANGDWTCLKSVEWLDFWLFGQLVRMVPSAGWLVLLVWWRGWRGHRPRSHQPWAEQSLTHKTLLFTSLFEP